MKLKIYLAGGFKGGWHDVVKDKLGEDFHIFNPQTHDLRDVDKYTSWDLFHVKQCDFLLGYMAKENPSGFGLALEIGYAKALDKLIILVDEKSKHESEFERYFSICHASSTIVLSSLSEAIKFIETFKR